MKKAVGGYFELELPLGEERYPQALKFQSARTAFYSLLITGQPKRVWMPIYICDAMLAPLSKAKIKYAFYKLTDGLNVSNSVKLSDDEWLLYVNYYGVCSKNIDELLRRFNTSQIVLDHSQAFYAPPRNCLATIYSPRKFFGVPDGGLLISKMHVQMPDNEDSGSLKRMYYLLKRLSGSPESGYEDFIKAEESLQKIELCQMSQLTQRLLRSHDHEAMRRKRNDNFQFLHKRLGEYNMFQINLLTVDGPLCYPFLTRRSCLREKLKAERIFVPTYWTDVLSRSERGKLEHRLVNECLPLPVDHRCAEREMVRISDVILQNI